MGRINKDKDRQRADFVFLNKPLKFYRPTESQTAALMMVKRLEKVDQTEALLRIFLILEILLVDPKKWQVLDDAMVYGEATMKDYYDLIEAVFTYEWPEVEAEKAEA
jgi:hypothetical protein